MQARRDGGQEPRAEVTREDAPRAVPPPSAAQARLDADRAAILATAVGLARYHLQHDRPEEALAVLDDAATQTRRLIAAALAA